MAKGHGGKRPGAGRKAAAEKPGAKTSYLGARISPETRAALELEAAEAGQSVSRMAEILLDEALESRRLNARNDSTRALCYVIGEMAEIIAPQMFKTKNFASDWRNDPFLFETYKLAIAKVMDALRPAGEVVSPLEREPALKRLVDGARTLSDLAGMRWGPLDTAERRAEYAAIIILHNLNNAEKPPRPPRAYGAPPPSIEKTMYDLHRAWRGLNKEPTK
ncbi:MAG: hypothetical protein J0H51_18705 [Rhizobiales bacterium]|nr:hypothetical protein [Hyphomicrobiales bacterium]